MHLAIFDNRLIEKGELVLIIRRSVQIPEKDKFSRKIRWSEQIPGQTRAVKPDVIASKIALHDVSFSLIRIRRHDERGIESGIHTHPPFYIWIMAWLPQHL